MPDACVLFVCNNTLNRKEVIGLHPMPFNGAEDPQKRKRRKKWVDFVKLRRAHWKPTKFSALCSKHFRGEDFTVKFFDLTGDNLQRRLRKDEVGVCVFPTVHTRAVQIESRMLCDARKPRAFGKVLKNDIAHQSLHTSI